MLKSTLERYNDGAKQLIIEKMYCDKCSSSYIKIRKKYGDGKEINVKSNIPFECDECIVCNNHTYDVQDLHKDSSELSRILNNTYEDKASTQLRAELVNNKLNQLWKLLYNIGKYGKNRYGNYEVIPSKVALKCTKCGYIKITDADDLDLAKNAVCNNCKQKLVLNTVHEYNIILKSIQNEIDNCKEYMRKQQEKPEQEDIKEVESKDASGFSKMKQRFKTHNPNMDLLAAYIEDDLQKSLICCSLCGTPAEVSTHRMKELRNFECSGCKEQVNNPNYLGLYKRDLTNTTKNGLVCKGQTENTVDLMCKYCGTTYKNKDKMKFLMGKIGCNKKSTCSSIEVFCPECMYGMEFKNKDIFSASAKDLVCAKCGTNIYTDAYNEIVSTDAKIEINEGLRYLSSQIKKPVKYESGIARAAEAIYRGTDGIDYYNCRCISHNQSCVLNEDEIQFNPHKYCNNIYNIFIDEIEFKNLKLNREASIAERKDK